MGADWADPGYFSGNSRVKNTARVLWQLIRPPRGHRTLPTKTGVMFILVTLGIGTAAFNTAQNILYLVLSLLLTGLLMSGILSWVNFKGCRWRFKTQDHYRVGEAATVSVEIENTKQWLPTYSLHFIVESELSQYCQTLPMRERVEPRSRTRLDWYFTPDRRGSDVLRLRGLVSKFPFGFLKKTIYDSYEKEVTVWPARCSYRVAFMGSEHAHRQGTEKVRRGSGAELMNLREYRKGDPLRAVHWKASAKLGELMVREMGEENRAAYMLCIEPSPHLWAEDSAFEKMCSFAATLGENLFRRDQLAGYVIEGSTWQRTLSLEDLQGFLTRLGQLDRHIPQESSSLSGQYPKLHFKPAGPDLVHLHLEDHVIGEA